MVGVMYYVCVSLFIFVCVVMIGLVLLQKGRGGGLASAFGGAGGNTAFGSKTGDVLTWATSVVFGIFLILAIVMNLVANQVNAQRTAVPGSSAAPTSSTPASGAPATPSTNTP